MKKAFFLSVSLCIVIAATLTTSSCKKSKSDSVQPTLYDSLGGTTMVQDPKAASGVKIESGRLLIRSIVDSTIFVIAGSMPILVCYWPKLAQTTLAAFRH
jgi:hypothetical protein